MPEFRTKRSSCPHLALLIGVLCALSPSARAADGAEAIMRDMDRSLTSASDQTFAYEMITVIPGRGQRSSEFTVQIKGDKLRRLEFKSPGDIKGMRVLILNLDQMYVYMPAYRKVRRVASHVRDQGFMGSAFSHDDMSVVTYLDKLAPKLLAEDQTHWTLEAVRRPDSSYRYAKLIMKVRKDNHQPQEITYFNDAGQKVKSERRDQFECQGKHCNPKQITLVDHTRGDVASTLKRQDWKVDTGIPDSVFTVRALQRRR